MGTPFRNTLTVTGLAGNSADTNEQLQEQERSSEPRPDDAIDCVTINPAKCFRVRLALALTRGRIARTFSCRSFFHVSPLAAESTEKQTKPDTKSANTVGSVCVVCFFFVGSSWPGSVAASRQVTGMDIGRRPKPPPQILKFDIFLIKF